MEIKCPACAAMNHVTKTFVFDSSRSFNEEWTRCSNCHSYFVTASFDEQTEVDTNLAMCNREEDGVFMNRYKSHLFETVIALAKKYHTVQESWLDIGCSYGGLLLTAKQNGFARLEGTEIVPEAIQYCAKNTIEAHRVFSVKDLPAAKTYDVISAIDSNMFWTDQPEEISLIRQRLNPEGLLILKVVDRSWLVSLGLMLSAVAPRISKKLTKAGVFNHRFSMPVKSMIHLLKQKGFDVIHTSINDALPSSEARPALKMWHRLSSLLFTVSGIYLGPTMLIVARKTTEAPSS